MKRYKVLAPIIVSKGDGLIGYIKTDTEICLEEVEDEISSHTARGSKHDHASSSAFGTEEVKEEKEVTRGFAGCSHGSGRVCRHCYKGGKLKIHTDYTNFHITEDQPKEEKDICPHGFTRGSAGAYCPCKVEEVDDCDCPTVPCMHSKEVEEVKEETDSCRFNPDMWGTCKLCHKRRDGHTEVKEGRKCPNCHGKKLEDCWCSPETFMCSCHDKEDQPKEEKECKCVYGPCYCKKDQPKGEEQAIVGEQKDICGNAIVKDQPLTPKDVGMSNRGALRQFLDWYYGKNLREDRTNLVDLSDEEFDRLYQEFLKEQLNNK